MRGQGDSAVYLLACMLVLFQFTDYTDPGHQVKVSCTAAAHLNAKLSAGPGSVQCIIGYSLQGALIGKFEKYNCQ
jgi:hypothetical protein